MRIRSEVRQEIDRLKELLAHDREALLRAKKEKKDEKTIKWFSHRVANLSGRINQLYWLLGNERRHEPFFLDEPTIVSSLRRITFVLRELTEIIEGMYEKQYRKGM